MTSSYEKDLIPQEDEGITDVRWVETKEALELLSKNSYPSIMDVMEAYLKTT